MAVLVFLSALVSRLQAGADTSSALPVRPRTIPHTDVNPYGANFFLQWEAEPWKVEKTLQMAQEAGIGWVKQQFPWEELEPKKGRYWDDRQNRSTWEKYDRIVELAAQNGMQVIARLDRPPAWSRKDNSLREAPPDDFNDYGNFVHSVVSRYKGKIRYYVIWNEPNIRPEWGNQPPDPAAYVRLLKIGYERAKQADPNAFILSAPLAQTLERSSNAMNDLDYLEQMYQNGAGQYFDILFANAYGFSLPPEDPPDPQRLNFRRVELARQIMERYGDAQKPIWFNEFGWNASPDDFQPGNLSWGRVTEPQQAQYTVNAIRQAREEWPWAGIFCIWYFRQAGQIHPYQSDYYFRMVDVGFTPRLVYHSVKSQASTPRVAAPGRYQSTNPALKPEGGWWLAVDQSAMDGTITVSEQPDDSLTINFQGSDISLLMQRGPDAGIAFITVDGVEANLLPSDRAGKSYLDLYAPWSEPQAEIPVSRGLALGKHTLRLTISSNRNPASKGNRVAIDGFVVEQAELGSWWVATTHTATPYLSGGVATIAALAYLWAGRRAKAGPPRQ